MLAFLRRTRVRLALGVGIAFLAVASLAAAGLWLEFSHTEYGAIDASLSAQTQSLMSGLQDANGKATFSADPLPAQTPDGIAVGALLVDASGNVLDTSGATPTAALIASSIGDALSRRTPVTATVSFLGTPHRVLASPVDTGSGTAVLVVSRPIDELRSTFFRLAALLSASVLLLTAVVSLLAYRLTGRAMRPVRAIAATARDISEHDLHRRLDLDLPPDELGELAGTFNGMLTRLESAFAALQRFTADAAHELRAPLTRTRTELEVTLTHERPPDAYRDALRVTLAEVEHLSRIADRLLTLARADAGVLVPARRRVDLGDLADETVHRWQPVASRAGVELRSEVVDEGAVDADPELLRRVLDNLIDNALRHTPAGGAAGVEVARSDGAWTLTVRDTGPGVPPEQRPSLFDRFTRGDAARGRNTGGAGLGLSLCRAIAEVHSGSISLEESSTGARFVLRLPGA
jgi:heavy metal sensor kinase